MTNALLGSCGILGGIIVILLPETKDTDLCETIQDVEDRVKNTTLSKDMPHAGNRTKEIILRETMLDVLNRAKDNILSDAMKRAGNKANDVAILSEKMYDIED